VRVVALDTTEVRLNLIIGDVLQNLRSALDHIVWHRSAPHLRNAKTGFPLSIRRRDFPSVQQMIHGLSPSDQAIVESFQPYHAGNELDALRTPLRVLHDLNVDDKHCFVHLAWVALDRCSLVVDARHSAIIKSQEVFTGPFDEGAVLARVIVSPPEAEVDMEFRASFSVSFAHGTTPWDIPLRNILGLFDEAVTNALRAFPRFPEGYDSALDSE
jgi:hypothetical protein